MSARHYRVTGERHEGQVRSVIRLTCRACGVSHAVTATKSTTPPPEFIERKFRQAGWEIGTHEGRDLCPGCVNKKEKLALKIVTSEAPVSLTEPHPSPSETPPRVMSRDDRRIIFDKLNGVYLDEKRGYDSGWSDQRVATDLGVPRQWVQNVRKEMFGDNGANEDMTAFLEEAEALIADARKMLLEAREHREKAEELLKTGGPNDQAIRAISERLGKIERLAAEVRKLVTV